MEVLFPKRCRAKTPLGGRIELQTKEDLAVDWRGNRGVPPVGHGRRLLDWSPIIRFQRLGGFQGEGERGDRGDRPSQLHSFTAQVHREFRSSIRGQA